MNKELLINDLHVKVADHEIIKGLNLQIKAGETVALMGPNGSGKSTLAHTIMGHPGYEITQGTMSYSGKNLLELEPEERSGLGLFLSFQQPTEIPGLKVYDYLKAIREQKTGEKLRPLQFRKYLREQLEKLQIDEGFTKRYLNEGFSGGEKKRMEILQMAILEPTMAVLDETDSGLDIDALRHVANGVNTLKNDKTGILVITHYQRILTYLKPHRIVIMMDGKIVREGGPELVDKLESEGYTWVKE